MNNQQKRRSVIKAGLVLMTPHILGLGACTSRKPSSFDADVIVVGAGLSGLNAALQLEQLGYKVMVVEATARLGGRVHTADKSIVDGFPELGANGIGRGYARVLHVAKKYNVKLGPMRPRTEPRNGEQLYAIRNSLISPADWPDHQANPYPNDYKAGSASSPPWSVYSKLNPLPKNDLSAWSKPMYQEWDRSVYSILKEQGFSDDAIALGAGTNVSYGVDEHTISALMYFQILTFIAQQSAANGVGGAALGGNQRIPEAMGNAFQQDILTSSPIESLSSQTDKVVVTLKSGRQLQSKYAIVTLPTHALRHIKLDPLPPTVQGNAFQEIDLTPCVQLHFNVKTNYWEEDGLEPSMWTDTYAGRFMALKNDPENPDRVTSCLAYINGNQALELDKMTQEEAVKQVIDELVSIRPSLQDALELAYFWSWSNNPYAGGAYAYWQPGQITKYAQGIANPIGRIHFAGEHTAKLNRGMEGAMESGERAAFEVMNLL